MSEWEKRSGRGCFAHNHLTMKRFHSQTSLTKSLLLREHIGDVSEVNARDNLLGILDWHTWDMLTSSVITPGHKSSIYICSDSPCRRAASTVAAGKWCHESCKCCGRKCVLVMPVPPCPVLSPTGPTQHSGLQQWPGGSLLSLGLTGADNSVNSHPWHPVRVKNYLVSGGDFFHLTARSYPSHLAITGQEAVKSTEVAHYLLQGFPNDQSSKRLHSTHHYRARTILFFFLH